MHRLATRIVLAVAFAVLTASLLAPPAQAAWSWPLRGELIGTYRNGDDPYAGGQHRGIDIAGAAGARVVAAAGGEVRFAGTAGSSGLTVAVRTADGFDTSYLHLSSVAVREGVGVSAGDTIGAVGTSGRRSAVRPHLHFGVRAAGTRHDYRNPLDFLPVLPAPPRARAPDPHPAPLPAPVPPARAPAPAPVGGRVPAPESAPDGAPRRMPLGGRVPRRVPVAGRDPRRVPVGGRAPSPEPASGHASNPGPATAPAPSAEPGPRPLLEPGHKRHRPLDRPTHSTKQSAQPERPARGQATRPAAGPAGTPEPHGSARSQAATADRGPAERSGAGSGPDIGWILACAGLLLAAALLGSTNDGRRAARTGRKSLLRLLQPLTGRS